MGLNIEIFAYYIISSHNCTLCSKNRKDCTVMSDKVVRNLRIFDAVDFDAFNYKKDFEGLLRQTHTPDVIVTYPSGNITTNMDQHIAVLDGFFGLAAGTNVNVHLLTLGDGKYSAQLSYFEGTVTAETTAFYIQGNRFKTRFATFNVWNSHGSFPVEKLVWDNLSFNQQIADPNQQTNNPPAVYPNADFLLTSMSDTANVHTATYFQVPYCQKEVDCNLKALKKFYKYVNNKRTDCMEKMIHETVSFVKADGLYEFTRDRLMAYLSTLDLTALGLTSPMVSYSWSEPSLRPVGSRDWTAAVGIIEVSTASKHTAPSTQIPTTNPSDANPIQMATFIRWHAGKISEIQMLWDNNAILTQLN